MSNEEKSLEQQAYDKFYACAPHLGDKESLRDLAINYAIALKYIADSQDYAECCKLLDQGIDRFVDELRRFGIFVEYADIQAEYLMPLSYHSKPELFVHYRGVMFASIKPDSLHVVGATVAVQKICTQCEQPFYKWIFYNQDWLYEMGVFMSNDDPCYRCS